MIQRRPFLAISFLATFAAFALAHASGEHAPGELIVTFAPEYMPTSQLVSNGPVAFGLENLDSLLGHYGCISQQKFMEEYIPGSNFDLTRMFLLRFENSLDVTDIRDELAQLPCFSSVWLNLVMERDYGALRMKVPATATKFSEQWYYHDPDGDLADLDAPEAWAITKGDPSVIVVIHDSGIMFDDTDTEEWKLHSDLRFHWTAEDRQTARELEEEDLDYLDSSDPDLLLDNVIGYNFAPIPDTATTEEKRRWKSIPKDWKLGPSDDFPFGVNCVGMNAHGTQVATIALGGFTNGPRAPSGGDIVGMASGCSAYIVRSSGTNNLSLLSDEISAIRHAALYADVMNMSWGYTATTLPDPLISAIAFAADSMDCVLVSIVHNDGFTNRIRYPARDPRVMAVGAINRDLALATVNGIAGGRIYSNYNASQREVDVVAPVGSGIPANSHTVCEDPCPCSQDEAYVTTLYGTSFAAPQVTGIAALVRSQFPSMRQDSVRARIKRAAEYYWSAADSVKYGSGKVNAYRSITEWGRVPANSSHVAHWGGQRAGWPDTLYVSGDLFVAASDTLVLNRGTVICIAPDPIEHDEGDGTDPARVEIIVRGTLRVGATGTGPVVFESFTPGAPTGSDWAGIRFEAGSRAILRNVIIRNAVEDVVVDEFDVTVADWDQTKTLYLNANHSISADRTIAVTDSLFVLGESDVIVSGGSGVDITVNGSLICKGSASRRPEFRSQSGNPYSWGVMTLASGSESHEFFNTDIRHASLAIRTYVPLTVDGCEISAGIDGIQAYDDLTVRNTTIRDMTAAGILLRAGDLDVENVTIHDCAYGIDQSTTTSTGTITCVGSHLHDLVYRGISVPFASGGVEVRRTRIERATDGIFLAYQSPATIDTCTIRLNEIGVLGFYGSSTLMRDCDLDSNVTAGYYAVAMTTTLEADTASHGAVGVFYQYGSGGSVGGNSRLTNNGVGLKCDLSSSPVVRETRISNNTDGVVALSGSSPDLGQSAGEVCGSGQDEGKNSIHANSGYHVYNATSSTLLAECNWWGGAPDSSKFYGSVDYVPYRSDDPNPAGAKGMAIGPPPPGRRAALPTRYDLSPGQPNPFNPVTTIAFDVPPPGGAVRLVVYDVRGARVRVLVDGPQTAGSHAVTWNGRDEHGAPAASGVYFVQMSAPSFSQTRKVVMLK